MIELSFRLLVLMAVLLGAGCGTAPSKTGLPSSNPAFKSLVSAWIKPGEDLASAKKTLEQRGFRWSELDAASSLLKYPGDRALYASHGETPPFIGITRYRWWIIIVHHDGKTVRKVKASVDTDITMDL